MSNDGNALERTKVRDPVSVVVELKSVDVVHPRHVSQVLSYMRVSEIEIGLIINFNVEVLIHGVKRLILTKSG